MKCPKCGYVSHDYLDACRKCSINLIDFKNQMQLHSIRAGEISLVSLLSDVQPNFAATTGLEEPFFNASMLADTDADDGFDISLDNEPNISPISISIADESVELSRLMRPPKPDADDSATPSAPATEEHEALGPPQSGYATIVLDVSSFETKSPEAASPTPHPPTDAADVQEPAEGVDDDVTRPLDTPTHDDPAGPLDRNRDEDLTAAVETRPMESPFSRASADEEPIQMPDVCMPFDESASDAYELSDTDVSRIEFGDTALSTPTSPVEEVNLDESGPGADLLPELPDLAADDPNPLELALESETFVDAFEAPDSEAMLPDLPPSEASCDRSQDLSCDDAAIVEESTPPAWPSEAAASPPPGHDIKIPLDVDPFADRQATDDGAASSDPMLDRDETLDSPESTGIVMPSLEWDNRLSDFSPTDELDTLIDGDSAISGDVMPDLPDLNFDTGMTSEDTTLVDDLLASDLGLDLNETHFDLPSAKLPPQTWTEEAGEPSAEDDDAEPNDAP